MIKVSYQCTKPLEGDSPRVSVLEDEYSMYTVKFIDAQSKEVLGQGSVKPFESIAFLRQWYTPWRIEVFSGGEDSEDAHSLLHTFTFDLTGKVVFIKVDASALGDNLAWMPYIEEFRKLHTCKVICSTFFNDLFSDAYPNIMFVAPNTHITNVYAQYYIGTANKINIKYSPTCYLDNPLQKIACDILGLHYQEIRPKITRPNVSKVRGKICISEFSSLKVKDWNIPGGWQAVVDFLNERGFWVTVISKEYSYLKNVINKSGPIPLQERIIDLLEAEYFIGVSSGLAWLSWALGVPTVIISDFTPFYHEPQDGVIRIGNNPNKPIEYAEVTNPTTIEQVLSILNTL
jgi:autotransporter strand-loop-strand O-heptosyltransferase